MSSGVVGLRGGPLTARPVPMKLFADTVDRTTPSCIPRLCTLTLSRVRLFRPLEGDLSSFSIAVKMQSSRRAPTRSSDIPYVAGVYPEDPHKVFDCELDLQFSLQYPHFIKRGGNQLLVMIQRKKKYKNRTMLGYKTLAQNSLNMCEVLQGPVDKELALYETSSDQADRAGERRSPLAVLTMASLSTQPVFEESNPMKGMSINERFSDDDSDENSSDVSDEDASRRRRSLRKANRRGSLKASLLSPNAEEAPSGGVIGGLGQRNFKQKFIALLRKFRAADEAEASDGEQSALGDANAEERRRLEDLLFDELSNLSDLSGGPEENDDLSITSTPKPSLRPFFSSLTLVPQNQSGVSRSPTSHMPVTKASSDSEESGCDSTPDDKKLFQDKQRLPSSCFFVDAEERHGSALASALKASGRSVWLIASGSGFKSAMGTLMQRVQNFCNNNSRSPRSIKVVLMGNDSFVNHMLRVYVEQFSLKTPEWMSYFRFFLIPLSSQEGTIARYLSSADANYPFTSTSWFETLATQVPSTGSHDVETAWVLQPFIDLYLSSPTTSVIQLPIAEVMLTLAKQDSTQAFVPFVTEVRIEGVEDSTSPPGDSKTIADNKVTPPNSPAQAHQVSGNLSSGIAVGSGTATTTGMSKGGANLDGSAMGGSGRTDRGEQSTMEPMDLQIDFWTVNNKEASKCTLKGTFRHLQVRRLPPSHLLTLSYSTKEKVKQKVMRLGKKKTSGSADESVLKSADGIQRLICSSKNAPLRVTIDGTEWTNVKFFQLSSQWQTHVKTVPFAVNQLELVSRQALPSLSSHQQGQMGVGVIAGAVAAIDRRDQSDAAISVSSASTIGTAQVPSSGIAKQQQHMQPTNGEDL